MVISFIPYCRGWLALMLLVTTTPTTMAMTATTTRAMKKQIQRFFRAARADLTASVVCFKLTTEQQSNYLTKRQNDDLPSFCVVLYTSSLCLDGIYRFVLLFNENTHLAKERISIRSNKPMWEQ